MTRYALLDKSRKTRLTTEAPNLKAARKNFLALRTDRPFPEGWTIVKREVEPFPKFKVGDLVRVTKTTEWYTAGDIGAYRGGVFNVDFSGQGNRKVVDDGQWSVPNAHLELAPKKEAPKKLKPGRFQMKMDSGDTLEFWLNQDLGGAVNLRGCVSGESRAFYIVTVMPAGVMERNMGLLLPGLQLNKDGEVMM